MLVPVGKAVDLAVDVVNVSSPTLRACPARVRQFEDQTYTIELDEEARDIEIGARLVVNFRGTGPRRRVTATVRSREGRVIRAEEQSTARPDHRAWPRLAGGVPLRYRPVETDDPTFEVERWLNEELSADGDGWRTPDPFMNFSVTGLRFDDEPVVRAGQFILCELGVGGGAERWRAVGRVVRVAPIDPSEIDSADGERSASHSVAVHFVALPDEAGEALTDYAIRLQRAQM